MGVLAERTCPNYRASCAFGKQQTEVNIPIYQHNPIRRIPRGPVPHDPPTGLYMLNEILRRGSPKSFAFSDWLQLSFKPKASRKRWRLSSWGAKKNTAPGRFRSINAPSQQPFASKIIIRGVNCVVVSIRTKPNKSGPTMPPPKKKTSSKANTEHARFVQAPCMLSCHPLGPVQSKLLEAISVDAAHPAPNDLSSMPLCEQCSKQDQALSDVLFAHCSPGLHHGAMILPLQLESMNLTKSCGWIWSTEASRSKKMDT